jgi:2-amino-4-hydroxy-6-hydroxymethyldihydropteridine diphosphokinase
MVKLYILLGGNLGDKQFIFSETCRKIELLIGEITRRSAIYETEPWGFISDDMFWNQVLEISTALRPDEVLKLTQQIEKELGRLRNPDQYDSRTIDIDILFYGNQVITEELLTIPHPRIQDRNFVLVPLAEIIPEYVHPVFERSIGQLLDECRDELKVAKL